VVRDVLPSSASCAGYGKQLVISRTLSTTRPARTRVDVVGYNRRTRPTTSSAVSHSHNPHTRPLFKTVLLTHSHICE
jgi:hypothetical protein